MAVHDFHSSEYVSEWADSVNDRRPERLRAFEHISEQVSALPFAAPQVVELGPGPGMLAEALLARVPAARYLGIDFSEEMLALARPRLTPFGDRAVLRRADLNEDDWPALLTGEVHAIVSLQALHDLGDESHVERIYRMARKLLVPGGLFLNTDLVVPPGQDNPQKPGRRSVPRHLELLRSHGYARVACTFESGQLACCVGYNGEAAEGQDRDPLV